MYMLIGLVSLILCVRGRWVDETGCLRAIGFLNHYNKVKLGLSSHRKQQHQQQCAPLISNPVSSQSQIVCYQSTKSCTLLLFGDKDGE